MFLLTLKLIPSGAIWCGPTLMEVLIFNQGMHTPGGVPPEKFFGRYQRVSSLIPPLPQILADFEGGGY